jgi:hypothetical protein
MGRFPSERKSEMTTKVVVEANHGWPVKVTGVKVGTLEDVAYGGTVPAGEKRDFHVHSSMDIVVHEIQPNEAQNEIAAGAEGEDATESEAAQAATG